METKLPIKYRPKSFSEYVGNATVVQAVQKAIMTGDNYKPQVLLFEGTSGCGKTTAARLVAKEYIAVPNHEEQLFDEYILTGDASQFPNLHEVDVSQDRGIASMEAIKEDMNSLSFDNAWKVYIFDEFHIASYSAQTSLLKILEDTPERVLVILCTTDKNKVLPTIRSRVDHIYSIRKPSRAELVNHLARICNAEGIKFDTKGLGLIADVSRNQIRDAIRNLVEVQTANENAKYSSVAAYFDILSDNYATQYIRYYYNRDTIHGLDLLAQIKEKHTLEDFYYSLRDLVIKGVYAINGTLQEGVDEEEMQRYRKLFKNFTPKEVLTLLQKVDEAVGENLEIKLMLMLYQGIEPVSVVDDVLVPTSAGTESTKPAKKKSFIDVQKEEKAKVKEVKVEKEKEKEADIDLTSTNEPIDFYDYVLELGNFQTLIAIENMPV